MVNYCCVAVSISTCTQTKLRSTLCYGRISWKAVCNVPHRTQWVHYQPLARITCNGCPLLQQQLQAANAEKGEELMTADVLLAPTLSLLWNPGLPSVKALCVKVRLLWIYSGQNVFAGTNVCVYIVYLNVHSWTHMYALPFHNILPSWHRRKKPTFKWSRGSV